MKKVISVIVLVLSMFAIINCKPEKRNKKESYVNSKTFPVEGDGFWDYITMDEKTDRLFISHSTVTQVLNANTGELIGTVPNTPGVHGIALDHELNKAYISCGRDSSVVVINLQSLKYITRIKTMGVNPDAILYDKFSGHVFVYNGGSSNATVINSKTDSIIGTISLAGKPEFSVSDGNGKVYVNIEDKSMITQINSKNLKIENTWSLAPGEEPSGLALDTENHRLFAVCANNKMMVMNSENGEIISTLDIGEGSDGCMFDPKLKRIYSSNGEGTLTVVQQIDADHYSVSNTIKTRRSARTLCINKNTHHIYLPSAELGRAPSPTIDNPHPRPEIIKGSFAILDIATN